MRKPVLYLHRNKRHWLVVLQGQPLGAVAARDVRVEEALRMAQAAYPEYDVRVWVWEAPKLDAID